MTETPAVDASKVDKRDKLAKKLKKKQAKLAAKEQAAAAAVTSSEDTAVQFSIGSKCEPETEKGLTKDKKNKDKRKDKKRSREYSTGTAAARLHVIQLFVQASSDLSTMYTYGKLTVHLLHMFCCCTAPFGGQGGARRTP